MLILGVDTSGKNGSIALVRFDSASVAKAFDRKDGEELPQRTQSTQRTEETHARILEVVSLEGGTFSAQLIPQISELLQKNGLTKQQIDAFAVVSGPGSFTGLRVGLAAIKALAEILQKPIAAVSLLEALALSAKLDGRVVAAVDAGRGEVYVGTYEVRGGSATCISEEVLSTAELTAFAAKGKVVMPDQNLVDVLTAAGVTAIKVEPPRADSIAMLGFRRVQSEETVTPEALDATYIRRSEAEIKFAERAK